LKINTTENDTFSVVFIGASCFMGFKQKASNINGFRDLKTTFPKNFNHPRSGYRNFFTIHYYLLLPKILYQKSQRIVKSEK